MEGSWRIKHWWEWLAYGFFSRRARTNSSLETLILTDIGRMATAEITAFGAVLTPENPEKVLLGCPWGFTSVQDATLMADSLIRCDVDEPNEPVLSSDILKFASPIPFIRVLRTHEDSEWVDAIVPGYGRCQIQRQNLVLTEQVDNIRPGNNLKDLEVHFVSGREARDLSGLPPFLAAVGASLKKLTINAESEDVDVKMVLGRCPNLERFCFMQELDTAIFNFSDFHAVGSPLPALTFKFDDTPAFTGEMMNPDNALTKCLQRLTITRIIFPIAEMRAPT